MKTMHIVTIQVTIIGNYVSGTLATSISISEMRSTILALDFSKTQFQKYTTVLANRTVSIIILYLSSHLAYCWFVAESCFLPAHI